MQELLALYSYGAMNVATPKGRPLGRSVTIKKTPWPQYLGEALRWVSFVLK
jgi:hypothetical protein